MYTLKEILNISIWNIGNKKKSRSMAHLSAVAHLLKITVYIKVCIKAFHALRKLFTYVKRLCIDKYASFFFCPTNLIFMLFANCFIIFVFI